jgi:4-amino-4-deoxy-L-arabinose transferase-like glycosyltransferase
MVLLLFVFALALVLRVAWIAYANPSPNDGRFGDEVFYDHAGQALAAGKGFTGFADQQTANWPPGYPAMLAVIYKVFGHHVTGAKALNAFAGAATCLLVYAVGRKVFNRRVGLIAALLLAFFPGQIYFSTLVMTESVFPAIVMFILLLALMWIVERERLSSARLFILGVLCGLAALTRSEAAVLLVAALVVLKLVVPSWRRFARQGSLLVAGAVLIIAPWTVRNAFVMKAFIPIVSGMGHTLLSGHQDDPYNPYHVLPEAKLRIQYAYLPFPERETKVEDVALHEAIHFIVTHPAYEVQLLFEKSYHMYKDDSDALLWIRGTFFNSADAPWLVTTWFHSTGEKVVTIPPAAEANWSHLADSYYYLALLAALAGVPLWFSLKDRKRFFLVLIVLGWTGAHIMFIPSPRYHAALIPILCLWAAVPLAFAWDRLRPRPARVEITVRNDADGTQATHP